MESIILSKLSNLLSIISPETLGRILVELGVIVLLALGFIGAAIMVIRLSKRIVNLTVPQFLVLIILTASIMVVLGGVLVNASPR